MTFRTQNVGYARILSASAALACVCSAGCNSKLDSSVQGTVTINGELADHGTVAFHPTGGGAPAYGLVAKNGSYSLRVGQGKLNNPDSSKIPSGEYTVTAIVNAISQDGERLSEAGPPKPGPRMTADKYANTETSPLKVTVKPGANNFPIELEGAAQMENGKTPGDKNKDGSTAAVEPNAKSAADGNEGPKQ